MALIHVLDDDKQFSQAVQTALQGQSHQVRCFDTPHAFFYQLSKEQPRCALIDWALPEMQGVDVVRRVRRQAGRKLGLIMLTAMDGEENVVQALSAGADDYIVKPGPQAVLAARVDALLRRLAEEPAARDQRIELGPYVLDFAQQTVCVCGEPVELTPRELDLAWTLFSCPSRLFTKQELLSAIWGKNCAHGYHTISQHVYSIRKKLSLADHGFKLLAVYASGYRLQCPDAAPTLN
jgi:DNA-binding response OmpR family regulator